MARAKKKRNPVADENTTTTTTEPTKAKVELWPVVLTTFATTLVAVITTYFVTRRLEKKEKEKELEAERARQNESFMNPELPMMWPGMQSNNPRRESKPDNVIPIKSFAKRLDRIEQSISQRESVLDDRESDFEDARESLYGYDEE